MPRRKKTVSSTPLLDSLSVDQARFVLARLIGDDPALAAPVQREGHHANRTGEDRMEMTRA